MRFIELTKGYVTTVDDEDYEKLMQSRWFPLIVKRSRGTVVYAYRTSPGRKNRTSIYMHREILKCKEGVDHRDGDGLNNQRSNLRPATPSQNCANSGKRGSGTTSRFKGVYWHKGIGKWHAQIRVGMKRRSLGLYVDEMDAATAYNFAAEEAWGEFARFNLPEAA